MTKKTEFLFYASTFIALIVLWFFGIFLITTMRANNDLKSEVWDLTEQIRECKK